jgi:hypothetical protein
MRTLSLIALALGLTLSCQSRADSVLEYRLYERGQDAGKVQPVFIKNGQVLVKSVGGDQNLDILYNHAQNSLAIIDHGKHRYMSLDEKRIKRLARQAETLQPLLQGLGEQMAKLTPKQRAKWEKMLGDIPIDQLARSAQPDEPARLAKTGVKRKVAGYACETANVMRASEKMASVCLAASSALNLPEEDYAAIRALFEFSEKLAAKAQGLAGQFGMDIPPIALGDIAGIPIALRDLSKENRGELILSRVLNDAVPPRSMQIPPDYRVEQIALW